MAKKKKSRSGAHVSPRRPLSASPEQWERWQREAERRGLSWAEWARGVLDGVSRTDETRR